MFKFLFKCDPKMRTKWAEMGSVQGKLRAFRAPQTFWGPKEMLAKRGFFGGPFWALLGPFLTPLRRSMGANV